MNFTEQLKSHEYTKKELLISLFAWAYPNDHRLYCNLDDAFTRHAYSDAGASQEIRDLIKTSDYNPEEVMKLALSKCDYHDSLRFGWSFGAGSRNRENDYHYKSSEKHRYSFMLDLVKQHQTALKNNGLDTFRKSLDNEKHGWYRGRLRDYLNQDKYENRAEILVVYPGNSVVNQIFHINIQKEYLQYALDNNIVSDPHREKLTYRPFGFKDYRNDFVITNLMDPMGGLIYLTTNEMIEIYNSIPKHKIPKWNKAEWAYIQSLAKNNWDDIKFYINLEKG